MSDPLPSPFERRLNRRDFFVASAATAALSVPRHCAAAENAAQPELTFVRTEDALKLRLGTRGIFDYHLQKPASGGSASESACYFHPFSTVSGTVVTDVGPEDHRHHRGIFLAWVEMHGGKDADFWGWGERAPTTNRVIVNRSLEAPAPMFGAARFKALNDWMADGQRVLTEDLRGQGSVLEGGSVLDITVRFLVDAEVTLARLAFGGLAVRLRKDGELMPISGKGTVKLPPPKHTDPESNWADAPWYGMHMKLRDGKEATVAVVGRSANPPTSWHIVSSIGLINPSVTAAGPIKILPDKPFGLRYRVMAFDGPPNLEVLNRLADKWYWGRP